MLKGFQKTILDLMFKQELLLAELYSIFGSKFPTHKGFWDSLVKEEKMHAEWINKLRQAEKDDLAVFDEGKVKTYALNTFIEHLEKTIDRAKDGDFNMVSATKTTLDLEMSLIEKNYFRHFHFNNSKFEWITDRLENETEAHINRVRELMTKLTQN